MCAKATVPGRDDLAFVGCSGICHWSSSINRTRQGGGGCFRIATDSNLLQQLPLLLEGRVILLEEVKQGISLTAGPWA